MTATADPAQDLRYEVSGHIARITINRPERGNSLTREMHLRIRDVWSAVRIDPQVRCVVVTAAGDRHFCTGTDVSTVAATGEVSAGNGPMSEEIFWSPHQNRVWKPVICAVNGLVAGGGLHFVVDADIVVAAEHAAFMDTHVNIGMVGAVENIGLARRLPVGAALRMTLQGRKFRLPAARAYQLGLVDELVPVGELQATADQIAADIAEASPAAVSLSKQAVWAGQEMGYRDAMEYGWSLARMQWSHRDFQEGPRAYAERREPRWAD